MSNIIALFASGSGSNVENIIKYFEQNSNFSFPIIISNRKNAYVHSRAKQLGIPSITLSKEELMDGKILVEILAQYGVNGIVLAGYLLKIPKFLIDNFPNRILNIHPALLPKYGGKGMYGDNVHKAVKAAGENESGITVHYVNEKYDEGNIVFQEKCSIFESDSYEDIADKVHKLEYLFFPKVIENLWK